MSKHHIDLDLDKGTSRPGVVRVRVGDRASCTIVADIYDCGAQADLAGRAARFECLKPDGTMVRDANCNISGSTVTYTLADEVSAVEGSISVAYFAIVKGADVVDTTQCITVEVLPNAEGGSTGVSESWYSEVDALLAKMEEQRRSYEASEARRQSDYVAAEAKRDQSFEASDGRRDASQAENDSAQAKNNADQAANNAAAQGLQVVLLAEGQYDHETLKPTIEGGIGKLYFVPASKAADDAYVEWMPIGGKWERVGMSNATLVGLTTAEIDSVAGGGALASESVLNGTGLSYLWSRLKAAFASVGHAHSATDLTSGVLPVDRGGTGAATRDGALTALMCSTVRNWDTADWNEITEPGVYATSSVAGANAPACSYGYGFLEVLASGSVITQRWTGDKRYGTFVRQGWKSLEGAVVWHAWARFAYEGDVAPKTHTHLYAGASKAGGAATSAARLETPRKIKITGAVNGSAAFDGSQDLSIDVLRADSDGAVKALSVDVQGVNTREGSITVPVKWPVDHARIKAVVPTYICQTISDRVVVSDHDESGITVRAGASQVVDMALCVLYV